MSTFFDIYIGEQKPAYKRSFNTEWRELNDIYISKAQSVLNTPLLQHTSDGIYSLYILGQLYDTITKEELLQRCKQHIDGIQQFDDPAGHYIIFLKTTSDTYVFTNRMGTYHAYYSTEQNNECVSTSFFTIVKKIKQQTFDWQGITGFMAMGYFPVDSTYFKSIKIFEPASCYRFDSDNKMISKSRYWDWQYVPEDRKLDEYHEELNAILTSSLRNSTAACRTALPVSGGLDSRMLAGLLTKDKHQGCKNIQSFSYGYTTNSTETKIASEIASTIGIPIHRYTLPPYLFDRIEDIADTTELFQYVDGTRQVSASQWLNNNADVVIGGHWGDVWMDRMNIHHDHELLPAFQKKIIKRGSAWLLDNICHRMEGERTDYLYEYFNGIMHRYEYIESPDYRMKIYKTDQWSFRWTVPSLRTYQLGAFPVLPFYDKNIATFFSKVPTELLAGRKFQIEFIKKYYPHLAKITWQEYDRDLYNYHRFNNRSLPYRIASKIKRTVSRQKVYKRNWEVFYLNPEGRKNLENILLNHRSLYSIVSKDKVEHLLKVFYKKPDAATGYSVSMLLTFAIFLNKIADL